MPSASIEEIHQAVQGETAPQRFLDLVANHPTLPALHSMRGGQPGEWDVWTLQQFADNVAKAAAGLQHAGLVAGERLLLMMRNRPDFHWLDTAAQFLRATPVSIYNSSSPEEIQYLASHADAEIAIVEDLGFAERILKVRGDLPRLRSIFVIDVPADVAQQQRHHPQGADRVAYLVHAQHHPRQLRRAVVEGHPQRLWDGPAEAGVLDERPKRQGQPQGVFVGDPGPK